MGKLQLALKGEYFDAIRDGTKIEEFRLVTPYWTKRLYHPPNPAGDILGRVFDSIVLTKGYPKSGDPDRTLEVPWCGFLECTITHPHFGPDPVAVFAIDVSGRFESEASQ